MSKWISVEERLPDDDREVLCKTKDGHKLVATYELYYVDDNDIEHYCWSNYAEDRACHSDPDPAYWTESATENIAWWKDI